MPLVSVVIPVYNGAPYVGTAIDSVLAQSYPDFELIVVDDGSSDETGDIVRRYYDPRISYHYQQNRGLSGARNSGVRLARGEWIAFLDCDDFWHPEKLARQVARAGQSADVGLIYCAARTYDHQGRLLNELPAVLEGDALEQLLLGNQVSGSGSSVMVRRTALHLVGGFDETLKCSEDWDLWLRLSAVTRFLKVDEYLVSLRDTPNSLGKRVATLRESNLRVLNGAFSTFASHLKHQRRGALSMVHLAAAINYQEQGLFSAATGELLRALWLDPTHLRQYWRLCRVVAKRR